MNSESNHDSVDGGRPVILIHGLGSSKRDWESVTPVLQDRGFSALTLDLLGHGDSSKPDDPSQYRIATIYSEFERWLQEQSIQHRVSLVGHSLGGYLAIKYALEHPDRVRTLVLVDPFYKPDQLSTPMRSVHRRPDLSSKVLQRTPHWLLRIVLSQMPKGAAQFPGDVRDRIADDLKRASPHILNVSATLPDLEPELPRMKAPTLVIWGEGDLTLKPSSFERLVEVLPNSVGRPFTDCGHQPHLAQPDVFNDLVADFLDSPHRY